MNIGLTGGIACGKSTVARILTQHGLSVMSADEIARRALEPDGGAFLNVVQRFGNQILRDDGQIDRMKLGAAVFADDEARKLLESLVHPIVLVELKQAIKRAQLTGLSYLIIEIPLLFEVGWEQLFDRIWVVSSSPEIQLERVQNRDHLTKEKAMQRIAAQLPLSYKEAKADGVIWNNRDLSYLETQVEQMIKTLE